ncbi:MAG: aminotransferase class I/II-fold pyridoxal phosphate-dependent enzyme [Armatimonadetes bacterium]|nr:aminotransferase class I/II-fold pyridoxal phosphate-dependent enzyme [Armatimonadota bacterium]
MRRIIDFRSDTVTLPPPAMLEAMAKAELGDDGREGDPTTRRLEERCACLLGKEAGLFVPSGTMGNLAALLTWIEPGDGVALERVCHIHTYERESLRLSGGRPYPAEGEFGYMPPEKIEESFLRAEADGRRARLLCLENTGNLAGGAAVTPGQMESMASVAKERGAAVHLDGARIFNAAVALDVDPAALAARADSVMFCFSKGLAAPVGSVLVGSADFIAEARQKRKILGGTMRQSGVLAAAALVALEEKDERLREDHAKARLLAEGLRAVPYLDVNYPPSGTNMVFISSRLPELSNQAVIDHLTQHNIRASVSAIGWIRFVTHKDVTRADVAEVVERLKTLSASPGS